MLATEFNSTASLPAGRIPKEFNILPTAEFEKTANVINMKICSKVLEKAKSRQTTSWQDLLHISVSKALALHTWQAPFH